MDKKKFLSLLALGSILILLYTCLANVDSLLSNVAGFLASTFSTIFIGAILAFVLDIPVSFFEHRFERTGVKVLARYARALSILVSLVVFFIAIAVVLGFIIPSTIDAISMISQAIVLDGSSLRAHCGEDAFPQLPVAAYTVKVFQPYKHILSAPNVPAAEFVRATQLDALAIAIGTSHGAYKFTRKPTGDILSISRVKEIHERLPNTHLVMHGSSSVPQEYLAEIREFGGDMRETYGVPVSEIQEAIKHGVRKVNIDTDIRLAMTAAIRRFLVENPSKFDPRDYLKKARQAAYELCKKRYLEFGCEGQGARIKPLALTVMAERYASGELSQKVI